MSQLATGEHQRWSTSPDDHRRERIAQPSRCRRSCNSASNCVVSAQGSGRLAGHPSTETPNLSQKLQAVMFNPIPSRMGPTEYSALMTPPSLSGASRGQATLEATRLIGGRTRSASLLRAHNRRPSG